MKVRHLELHVLGMTSGHWCDDCALPSGAVASIVIVDAGTLQVLSRGRLSMCGDCGRQAKV